MTLSLTPSIKSDLLAHMQRALDPYEQAISRFTPEQMLDTGMDNGSSFKDLLAHLSAWERLEIYWLEASLRGEQPARYYPGFEVTDTDPEVVINRLNAAIYQRHKDDLLTDVLKDFSSTHQRLVALVESLPEEILTNPQAFSWWRGEPVWISIAHNTYLHFQDHLDNICSWLEQTLGIPCATLIYPRTEPIFIPRRITI